MDCPPWFSMTAAVVFGLVVGCSFGSSAPFSELLAQADALTNSAAGRHYDNAVGQFAASNFGPVMKVCLQSTPNPSSTRFDVVAVLKKDGAVEKLLVEPDTNLASCISPTIRSAVFPAPPHAGYPIHIDWNFKK